ncbi:cystatin-like [Terrapene carolina triunguis]|uniref:Egg-white cystatin n=1 Tax=Terrapene triunguis TaxID=2587831 RepID=A0A674JCG4_9SAUR|nr:cystatin-like [Terrapene carolina triunguis]
MMGAPWLWLAALALAAGAALAKDRPPRLLGGLMDAEENDEGVQRALRFAMSEYNKASNDKYRSRVAEVLQARKQIVSGIKYYLNVKVGRTTCTKSSTDVQDCEFHSTPELAKHITCNFVVYTVPWLNKISLLENKCQ